jgi:branched-subunit amino acid transport protein
MSPALALAAAGLLSWSLRVLFIALVPARRVAVWLRGMQNHTSPAVVAALVATALSRPSGGGFPVPPVLALLVGTLVAWRTRSLLLSTAAAASAAAAAANAVLAAGTAGSVWAAKAHRVRARSSRRTAEERSGNGRRARLHRMELTHSIDPLRRRFRGALLRRGEEGYDEARRVWNGAIDRYPALVARCAGADDVTASGCRRRPQAVGAGAERAPVVHRGVGSGGVSSGVMRRTRCSVISWCSRAP